MGSLGSNQFALKEMFDAPIQEVFGQLCLLGSRYPLSPLTARLEPLTTHAFGIGSKWQEHRLHLFLRDIMECEVLQCKAYALSIVSNDGFNQLRYDFELTQVSSSRTALHCTVHCYIRPGGHGQHASPSEKLAIMMQRQDQHAMRQLKGAIEAEHAMPVC
ncbi:hypothetical protein ABBQ38_012766 [Trebouxia sp. C0009 RCD-2024]